MPSFKMCHFGRRTASIRNGKFVLCKIDKVGFLGKHVIFAVITVDWESLMVCLNMYIRLNKDQ